MGNVRAEGRNGGRHLIADFLNDGAGRGLGMKSLGNGDPGLRKDDQGE